MLRITARAAPGVLVNVTLTLPFERRAVTRQQVILDDGRVAGLFLPRGDVLRDGDRLQADDGVVVRVTAAPEAVYRVRASNARELARIAYHLGNRHVPVEVGEGAAAGLLKLARDHVLRDMIEGLGGIVDEALEPFEPVSGAYGHSGGGGGGGGHAHLSLAERMTGKHTHGH
jgi:urease accessory protein